MIKHTLGICLTVIALFSLMQACFAADSGTTPLPTPIGRVVWIKGTFTAFAPNNEVRTLQKKSIIYLYDTLKTDTKSQAEIVFTDNTLMTFREGSTYTIDKYSDKNKGKNGSFFSTLTTGGFRTITGLISKNSPDNYQVNTPVATIGVRGTDYQVVLVNGKLFVAVYSGKPCVTNKPKSATGKATTACLDTTRPYAEVLNPNASPVLMTKIPDELQVQLIITNAMLLPYQSYTAPGGTNNGSGGPPITSFCITQ